MLLIFLMYALTTLPLSKLLIAQTQPFFLIGMRMLCAGILLLGYYFLRKQSFVILRYHIKDFIQVIIFAIVLPYFLRYWALGQSSGSMVNFLCYTGPLITYLLAGFFNLETFSRIKEGALLAGYAGLLFLTGIPSFSWGIPELAIISSVLSFAYGWIIIRRLVVDYNYAPIFINGCTMIGAGFISLILSACTEPMQVTGDFAQFALVLTAVILISNIAVHTMYISFLKKYSLTFIQLCSLSAPIFVQYRSLNAQYHFLSAPLICATLFIALAIGLYYYEENRVAQNNIEKAKV